MMYGEAAHETFFRASDEQLDQAAAYPFMTPIFGEGVVFDATPEQRQQALRNSSLRDKMMRGHAQTIADETERMLAGWGDEGEVDLLDFFAELTIYTSSACLIGKEFRDELTVDFAHLFKELERGTDAIAYVNAHLPLPSFWKRDRARAALVARIQAIIDGRAAAGRKTSDLVGVLTQLKDEAGRPRYTADQITGMFISMMFAGHHTTSGTAAWTVIELLRHPAERQRVVDELEALYADGTAVSYQALRNIPHLEGALKETLRLHPPLVILMRKVQEDLHYKEWTIAAGKTVAVSPAVSNRMPEHFPDPERFDPSRYQGGRDEDKRVFAWLPFGAGRHRCIGAAFAMIQLKAIFSILLRRYDLEMAQPSASYRNDHAKMVVQIQQPCRVRYRARTAPAPRVTVTTPAATTDATRASGPWRVAVDPDLCQGHGVCAGECPEVFAVDAATLKVRVLEETIDEELQPAVERAVRYCPTRALRVLTD
jgi:sterol 14-demethylase